MKDKQRFMSSVIVSLLAGFICYQFGQGIQQNLEKSIKAVLSSNVIGTEEYFPTDCQPFNSAINNISGKLSKKKLKFYIKKRNTIEYKSQDITIPAEELFSELVSKKANAQRPAANKNVDFTSELEHLIKNDLTGTELKPGKEYKINKGISCTENEVADTREMRSRNNLLHKDFNFKNKYYSGNGFEYNYITDGNSHEYNQNNSNSKTNYEYKVEYNYNYHYNYNKEQKENESGIKGNTNSGNGSHGNRVKVIIPNIPMSPKAPKVHIKNNDNDCNSDVEEINVPDEDSNDDSM